MKILNLHFSIFNFQLLHSAFCLRFPVGKLIRKSTGLNHQRQPVRIRPQPPVLRSGVIGNTLGFEPRDSRFDPWLRSLRTWPNGSGACFRNKSMRVRVLPSVLLIFRLCSSDGTRASLYESEGREFESRRSHKCFVGLAGYNTGLVNRQRWFESSTKLLNDVYAEMFRVQPSGCRAQADP
jgi:hypothetical protein